MLRRRKTTKLPTLEEMYQDLERGQGPNKIGRPANAYFENDLTKITEEIQFEAKKNLEGKLYLGQLGGHIFEGPRLRDGRRNFWVEGGVPIGIGTDQQACLITPTRCGKGRAYILNQFLTYPFWGSIFSLDPKGDHARITARYRAEVVGQRVAVIDPKGASGEVTLPYRVSFNPLSVVAGSDAEAAVTHVRLVADALVVPGQETDTHWSECAREFLGDGLCLHVATHPKYEGRRDLVTVWELTTRAMEPDPDDDGRFRLENEMRSNPAGDGVVKTAAANFYEKSGGEFSSVLSNLRKAVAWIGSPSVRKTLRGPSIDLADLKRDSIALYVCVPAMQMCEMAGFLRMLLRLSINACEREKFTAPRPPSYSCSMSCTFLDAWNALSSRQG